MKARIVNITSRHRTWISRMHPRAANLASCGVVFKLDRTDNYTVIHSFHGTDGLSPYAGVIRDTTGNLYGTTSAGGASGYGVVFKLARK